MFDPKDILTEVQRIADGETPPPAKMLATEIANYILRVVKYDPNVVHVDCEVLQHDGILYSDVAVKEEALPDEYRNSAQETETYD